VGFFLIDAGSTGMLRATADDREGHAFYTDDFLLPRVVDDFSLVDIDGRGRGLSACASEASSGGPEQFLRFPGLSDFVVIGTVDSLWFEPVTIRGATFARTGMRATLEESLLGDWPSSTIVAYASHGDIETERGLISQREFVYFCSGGMQAYPGERVLLNLQVAPPEPWTEPTAVIMECLDATDDTIGRLTGVLVGQWRESFATRRITKLGTKEQLLEQIRPYAASSVLRLARAASTVIIARIMSVEYDVRRPGIDGWQRQAAEPLESAEDVSLVAHVRVDEILGGPGDLNVGDLIAVRSLTGGSPGVRSHHRPAKFLPGHRGVMFLGRRLGEWWFIGGRRAIFYEYANGEVGFLDQEKLQSVLGSSR